MGINKYKLFADVLYLFGFDVKTKVMKFFLLHCKSVEVAYSKWQLVIHSKKKSKRAKWSTSKMTCVEMRSWKALSLNEKLEEKGKKLGGCLEAHFFILKGML